MLKKWTGIVIACVLFLNASPSVVKAEMLQYSIEPQFDSGAPFVQGLAAVMKDGKYGYIDKKGMVVVPFKYDAAQNFIDGIAVVGVKDGLTTKFGFIDDKGVEISPITYDFAVAVADGYGRIVMKGPSGDVWQDGKTGLVGKNNLMVPPIYDEIGGLHDGMFNAKKDGKYGFLNANGKEVTDFVYEDATNFSDGLARVLLNRKYGFIDRTGQTVLPFRSEYVSEFSEGLASITVNGKLGYIDTFGNTVILPKYDEAWFFFEGLAYVARDGKKGYIDRTGKEVVPLRYSEVSTQFRNGLARVSAGEDYILKSSEGGYFGNDGNKDYRVLTNKKFGYVNAQGEEVVPLQYDYAEEFVDGYAKVSNGGTGAGAHYKDGKFGYIDTTGKVAVPLIYDFIGGDIFDSYSGFTEGITAVSNGGIKNSQNLYEGGKWGYVDKNGREIVPLIYDHTSPFRGGLGKVMKNGKYGFVDATGTEVIPCIYDDAGTFNSGMVEAVKGGKGGYIDTSGHEITEMNYEFVKPSLEGSAAVEASNKKIGFLNNPLPSVANVSIDISVKGEGQAGLMSITSATENASIYYTLDGSDPVTMFSAGNTFLYTKPLTLWNSTTIKAVGVAKGMQNTPFARMDYKQTYLPSKVAPLPDQETKDLPPDKENLAVPTGFVDVNEKHWARQAIQWAVDKKIVSGYADGTFRPDANVTEPEFLAMLLRAYPDIAMPVDANPGTEWYNPYYKVAEQNNWTLLHETDGKHFNRGQVALLLAASQGFSFGEMKDAIQYVLDRSIAGGKTSPTVEGFAMDDKLKRSEAITLIYNMKEQGFKLLKADITPGNMEREFKVRGISIGDMEKDVLAQLGEPARKDRSEYGFQWYIYNQDYTKYIQVGIKDGKVVGLYSNVDNWSSNRGAHLGSDKGEVIKRYGNGLDRTKGNINFSVENTKFYLQDGSYTTIFLDKYSNNTVTAIQLIEKSVEDGMTDNFAAETEELRTAYERQTLDLVNAIRVRFGLKAVEWDDKSAETARKHSEDMKKNKYFAHIDLQGKTPFDRMEADGIQFSSEGENIAAGQRSAIFAHEAWMNSKGHRDNILHDWDKLGVGVAFNGTKVNVSLSDFNMYYTQNFSKK